jgi:nucleotide-binding universal stress UspA family protein
MLPLRTILFATDFAEHAQYAFRVAAALARDHGARLLILHVQPPVFAMGGEGVLFWPESTETPDTLWTRLTAIRPDDPTIPFDHCLRVGSAAPEILRLAEESHADLIVLGTHGRRGLSRLLMGSVAEEVLRRAACPVLTVKTPVAEPAAEPACPVAEEPAHT